MSNTVNRGQFPNDQQADSLYEAFGKVNDKFTDHDDLKQVQDASEKQTPADNDKVGLIDSEAASEQPKLKWLSWARIRFVLKAYFDTIYSTFSGSYDDLSDKPTIPSTPGEVGAEPANANIQSHISSTQTPHVTAQEKTAWNNKSDLALGETSATAYRGDHGKAAHDHSLSAHAPSNATVNDTDANLKNRANHSGTQLSSSISDFALAVIGSILTGLSTAAGTAIAATDTILTALGKLQRQITDHLTNHPSGIGGLSENKIPRALNASEIQDSNIEQVPGSNNLIRIGSHSITGSSPSENSLLVSGKLFVGNANHIDGVGAQAININGAIKIGDGTGMTPGTIKYIQNDQDFQAYQGSAWKSIINDNITKAEIEAKLSGEIASHTHNYQAPLNADQIRRITFGTADPTGGSDNDIYLQYE